MQYTNCIFFCTGQLGRLSNKKILMLEAADKFWTKSPTSKDDEEPQFSNRVVAVSPGSKKFLSKLGIWDEIWRNQPVSCLQVFLHSLLNL